jgi:hypothetical protein
MKRITIHMAITLLAFIIGIAASRVFNRLPLQQNITIELSDPTQPQALPRFIPVGSLIESDYHIYWYRTPESSDPEEINFYGDFRSAEVTRKTFESNCDPDGATVTELGYKFDVNGRKVGRRGISDSHYFRAVRIFWTDGDIFWSVQAPSLGLALEFEQSEIVRAITMSNRSLKRTTQ